MLHFLTYAKVQELGKLLLTRHESCPPFSWFSPIFLVSSFDKINFCNTSQKVIKNGLRMTRDMIVMLERKFLVLKTLFFKLCSYCQESSKENSDFLMLKDIKVTVSLGGNFTHIQILVSLQVHFNNEGKP